MGNTCIHDKISRNYNPPIQSKSKVPSHGRVLTASSVRYINIAFDESNLKIVSDEEKDYILNKLVPTAKVFFEKRLRDLTSVKLLSIYRSF